MKPWSTVVLGLLVASCGSSDKGPTTPTPTSNRPPSASVAVTPSGVPLAAVTSVGFSATASDPDGDTVSFAWQFGDGQTASGQAVSHVFLNAGTYPVILGVTDSRGAAASVETRLVVKGVAGAWADADPRTHFVLTQSGLAISGLSTTGNRGVAVQAALDGALSAPRSIGFFLTYDTTDLRTGVHSSYRCRYEGTLDEAGDFFKVYIITNKSEDGCSPGTTFSATRQPQ